MSETQDVFNLVEFETISFECPSCKTEVMFRADGIERSDHRKCSECNNVIPAAGSLLRAYRDLYSDAKRLGAVVKLRGTKRIE